VSQLALIGPGAIGATFAAVAQRAGVPDVLLCGRTPTGRITVRPDGGEPVALRGEVHTDPADVGPSDWVLLAVKAHHTEGARRWLAALCGPGTVVAVLQNGVEHEERVAPLAGSAEVLPTVVWCPAEASDRQTVRLRGTPELAVPDVPAGQLLARLLEPGGARVRPVADFRAEPWRKLTINAVAGLMVLTGRRAGMYRRPDIRGLALALARECLAVAAAEGVTLAGPTAEQVVDELAGAPGDLGSSILFDRVAGRPLEWDVRNGVLCRLGARHGVPTPVSDVLAPLLAAASDDPQQARHGDPAAPRFRPGSSDTRWAWRSSSGTVIAQADARADGSPDDRASRVAVCSLWEGSTMSESANRIATRSARWRKSHYSNPYGECVQVAKLSDGQVAFRNSREPDGEVLIFTRAEMVAFMSGAKDGEFDYLVD
jgi:2-dehydropantoate 2-reductase